jgi:site-specific recombinase XerD
MSYDKLESRKERIQDNPDITEEDKEHVEDFLKTVKRYGAKSSDTQEAYLRFFEHVLEKKDFTLEEIREMTEEELSRLNNEIVDDIQDSYFKRKTGDLTKRVKNHQWTAWQRILQTLNISTEKYEKHMPGKVKFSTDKAKADVQADTKPEDLPTPKEMRRFLKKMEQISEPQVADRNVALIMVMWSIGPRIGEALNITMDQVTVNGKIPLIEIEGNKNSKDRPVKVGQGWKTLKEWISSHPKPRDKDAYLFYKKKNGSVYESLSKQPLRRKIKMAHRKSSVDFKTYGEPSHIFRKGYVTASIVNGWETWEEICETQGKKTSSTKPTYLKLGMSDVNASRLENLGVEDMEEDAGDGHRMKGRPLTPMKCPDCGYLNRCFRNTCSGCGYSLQPEELPDNLENEFNPDEELQERLENRDIDLEEMKEMAEKLKKLGI